MAQEWVAVQIKKEVRLKELEAKAAALEQGQEVGGTWKRVACCLARVAEQVGLRAVWCKVSLHVSG